MSHSELLFDFTNRWRMTNDEIRMTKEYRMTSGDKWGVIRVVPPAWVRAGVGLEDGRGRGAGWGGGCSGGGIFGRFVRGGRRPGGGRNRLSCRNPSGRRQQ